MEKINTSECQKQYKSPLEKGLQISAVLFCIYNLFRISSQGFLTSNLIENVILTASSILFLYGTSNKHIKSIGQYCMVMFSDVVYNFVNFMTNALGYMMVSEKANNNVKHEKRDVEEEEDFDIGNIAAAFGASEEAIEKAREAQQRAKAQGRYFTLASAADLAEAAGAPESVVSGLRSMGEKQIEELKEKGEKIFSKRDYQGYDLAEVARLLGAPEEVIEKVKKVQERAAAEGRVITLDGAADLAEAAGAPDFVVEQLRAYGANERAEIANEENQLPNLKKRDVEEEEDFDIGNIAAAFGASKEAIEKAREAQQRAKAQGRHFTLASAADLAEAAGAPKSVISGLRSMGEKQIEELKEKGEKIFSKRDLSDGLLTDAKLTNAFTNVETIGELNSMKKNMYVFGESGILALILGCFAYKYYRQIKRQIRNNANADVKYQQV